MKEPTLYHIFPAVVDSLKLLIVFVVTAGNQCLPAASAIGSHS